MKYLILIPLIIISNSLASQDYFSRILSTQDNPLIKEVRKVNDQYLIPTDFFANSTVQGGFIIVDEFGEISTSKYDNMDLCSAPLVVENNEYYLLGENPFREGDSTFFISKLGSLSGDPIWYHEFSVANPKLNPRTILQIENTLYAVNVELESPSNYPQEISIFVFDKDGNLLDIKKYNTNKWSSSAKQSFNTADNSIILSCLVSEDEAGPTHPHGQIIKLNKQGGIIWEYEGTEELANGAVPTWATELSDSTILQTYYVDKSQDVDFIVNNWFPLANRFIWLSKDGELIREKLIITEFEDRIVYDGVESGQGEYFYSYGYLESLDPDPGLKYSCHLTKFSNQGDTIWTHNYRHSNYSGNNIIYNIRDIIEEDNGDITVLADIRAAGVKTEVWLFKVNSDGCYVNEECEDMTDLVSTEETQDISQPLLFPNPALDVLHITFIEGQFSHIDIKDQLGNTHISFQSPMDSNVEIDISQLSTGVYYAILHLNNGEKMVKRFVKL